MHVYCATCKALAQIQFFYVYVMKTWYQKSWLVPSFDSVVCWQPVFLPNKHWLDWQQLVATLDGCAETVRVSDAERWTGVTPIDVSQRKLLFVFTFASQLTLEQQMQADERVICYGRWPGDGWPLHRDRTVHPRGELRQCHSITEAKAQ
jgi:hypothetical protein